MNPLVFLGGPPAAGKSTVAAAVRTHFPRVIVVNAGAFIRSRLGAGGAGDRVPVADGAAATRLQEILVDAVGELRRSVDGPILLDGHFAVPTPGGPQPVDTAVFAGLGCTTLVQLDATAAELAERLLRRGGAAWWDGSIGMLDDLRDTDLRQARLVAEGLGLPLYEAGSVASATRMLRPLLVV